MFRVRTHSPSTEPAWSSLRAPSSGLQPATDVAGFRLPSSGSLRLARLPPPRPCGPGCDPLRVSPLPVLGPLSSLLRLSPQFSPYSARCRERPLPVAIRLHRHSSVSLQQLQDGPVVVAIRHRPRHASSTVRCRNQLSIVFLPHFCFHAYRLLLSPPPQLAARSRLFRCFIRQGRRRAAGLRPDAPRPKNGRQRSGCSGPRVRRHVLTRGHARTGLSTLRPLPPAPLFPRALRAPSRDRNVREDGGFGPCLRSSLRSTCAALTAGDCFPGPLHSGAASSTGDTPRPLRAFRNCRIRSLDCSRSFCHNGGRSPCGALAAKTPGSGQGPTPGPSRRIGGRGAGIVRQIPK